MSEKEKKIKKSDLLRTKIYNHAMELYSQKGFENVKVSDICMASEISIGTFYYYFPSKEAVFLEYARCADTILESYAAELKCSTQAEKIRLLLIKHVELFSMMGHELGNSCFSAFLKHKHTASVDVKRSSYAHIKLYIDLARESGEFKKDIDSSTAVSSLRYMIAGLCLRWALSGEPLDVNKEAEFIAEQFISIMKA